MRNWARLSGSTALAIFMTGSAAFADVTAVQVWTDFKSYLEGFGYRVTGDERASGGTVSVSGMVMSMGMPDEGGHVSVTMDNVTFTETGDGRVRVSMSDRMPIAFTVIPPEGGEEVTGSIDYTQSGFDMVVSGDVDDMLYTYSAGQIGLALSSLIVEGEPIEIGQAVMTMSDVAGTSTMSGTGLRTVGQTVTTGKLDYTLDMTSPEDPDGRIFMTGGLAGLEMTGSISLPSDVDMNDMAAALRAGFAMDGNYAHSGGFSEFEMSGKGDHIEGNTTSDSGALTIRMNNDQMEYSGEANGVVMNYAGDQIPLPVSVEMARAGFRLLMPVGQSEEPVDFAFGLTLADVAASDMIWAMLDPTGQLPRDPATVEIDLTGKARMTQDLMDPQAMAMAAGDPPGEIHALTVRTLTLAIAGARLTGNGDFTFDNDDTTTFPGMPKPTGALDLELTGGNTLLDTLVAMGMLPQDQAMAARMMLGLFARPGAGPDSLTSQIEVTEDGQVLANGQRLR